MSINTTHDHGISQNGRKVQQNGLVAPLTERKKHKTRTISYHRTIIRKAHRLFGQKIDLRYPRAYEALMGQVAGVQVVMLKARDLRTASSF
jgi:hypothetical protein